jgi:hypothetical protein
MNEYSPTSSEEIAWTLADYYSSLPSDDLWLAGYEFRGMEAGDDARRGKYVRVKMARNGTEISLYITMNYLANLRSRKHTMGPVDDVAFCVMESLDVMGSEPVAETWF